jgi:hypothetical protein
VHCILENIIILIILEKREAPYPNWELGRGIKKGNREPISVNLMIFQNHKSSPWGVGFQENGGAYDVL